MFFARIREIHRKTHFTRALWDSTSCSLLQQLLAGKKKEKKSHFPYHMILWDYLTDQATGFTLMQKFELRKETTNEKGRIKWVQPFCLNLISLGTRINQSGIVNDICIHAIDFLMYRCAFNKNYQKKKNVY